MTAGSITVNFNNPAGGSIDLSGSAVSPTISTTPSATGSAGNVYLVADGTINTTGTTIQTSANTTGTSGNVTVIAASNSQTAVQLGHACNTQGINGSNATGNLTVNTSNVSQTSITYDTTGSGGGVTPSAGSTANTGGIIFANGSNVSAANVGLTAGSVTTAGISATGAVTIAATTGAISYKGNITAPGGLIMVANGAIQDGGNTPTLSTASSTGNSGNMTIVDGATFTQNATQFVITGASGNPQGSGFANGAGTLETTASTFSGGNGGNLNIISFNGNIQTGNAGTFNTVSTGGLGSGTNGNLLVIAGSGSILFSDSQFNPQGDQLPLVALVGRVISQSLPPSQMPGRLE